MEICGDNRFEIIAKAKEHLLEATNIDTSEDEMKVLDTFLFRCWQMGWLDRYDEQTEPQTDTDFTLTYTCSFSDCENFKHFGFGEKCIECKRKQSKAMRKTEPQTEEGER